LKSILKQVKKSTMKIQFNTDKTIDGDERHEAFFTTQISEALSRYQSHITRIEVHLSDENGKKAGLKDMRCLLEARLEGRQPIAVSDQADTVEQAVSGAIDKIKTALETTLGRIQNHEN
jgi:ribosome-associated translation inhibitor RaiA